MTGTDIARYTSTKPPAHLRKSAVLARVSARANHYYTAGDFILFLFSFYNNQLIIISFILFVLNSPCVLY